MPRWQWGVRSCIMPVLPMHLVQELNVGTLVIRMGQKISLIFDIRFPVLINFLSAHSNLGFENEAN